jgi:hypothetical protein
MKTPVKKASAKTVPIDQLPEVRRYVEAEDQLQEFIQTNLKLMNELSRLVDERNNTLQEADTAVRATCLAWGVGVTCGPFQFKHFTQKIDGEAMFDALGREQYERLGGAVKTVTQYVVDKTLTLKAIESGQISPEMAENFYQNIPNYHKIPVVVLP